MTDKDPSAPLPPVDHEPAAPAPTAPARPDPAATSPDQAHAAGQQPPPSQPGTTPNPGEPLPAGQGVKPEVANRALAYVIDWVIAMALYGLLLNINFVVGALAGAAYILLRDGFEFEFMRGRSVGKTMMKLTVVRDDGGKMDLMTSARRNWPMAIGMLPFGLFFMFLWPVAALIGLYEVYKVLTSSNGRRWGDELAGTRVVTAGEQP